MKEKLQCDKTTRKSILYVVCNDLYKKGKQKQNLNYFQLLSSFLPE